MHQSLTNKEFTDHICIIWLTAIISCRPTLI